MVHFYELELMLELGHSIHAISDHGRPEVRSKNPKEQMVWNRWGNFPVLHLQLHV